MKRVLKIAVCLILTLTTLCFTMGASCWALFFDDDPFPPPGLEWDGRFLYYPYQNNYAIVGTEPEFGKKTEGTIDKLYLPYYHNGKQVIYYSYSFRYDTKLKSFGVDISMVNEIYFPYQHIGWDMFGVGNPHTYYVPSTHIVQEDVYTIPTTSSTLKTYIPHSMLTRYCIYIKQYHPELFNIHKETDWYIIFEREDDLSQTERILYKANTAYMFNYEISPNNDYYFINNFERGGLIENTPYEPYREGYTFTGWYKDSECTQKWDFEVDTLPEPTYDENGELEYVETRLYAGWNKI